MNICFQNNTARRAGRGNRGSVLIMVVGILTMLFMLGATFMAISHMNAKQSAALAEKNPADPAAMGLLNNLLVMIGTDRHAGGATNTPYGLLTTGPDAWKGYIDYPQPEMGVGLKTDEWLASSGTTTLSMAGTVVIPHISDVLLQWSFSANATSNVAYNSADMVDTDGDGIPDSRLFDTGITNNNGEHYWAAVCVRDASSMINLNTAGAVAAVGMPSYTSPVSVDLSSLLGPVSYNALNYVATVNSRCVGGVLPPDMLSFNRDCATKLMNTATTALTTYRPYAIGDEMLLRWTATYATNLVGRLYDSSAILLASQTTRQLLTTYNSSSQFSRTGAVPAVVNNNDIINPLISYDLLTSPVAQNNLYNQVVSYLTTNPGGLGFAANADAQKIAVCFVANTLAYVDTTLPPVPRSYTNGTIRAYGTIPGCVITEVVAASKPNTAISSDDFMWFYAIEIWNPTAAAVPYKIYQVGDPTPKVSSSLAAGARIVYFNSDQGNNSLDKEDFSTLIPGSPVLSNVSGLFGARSPWLDFSTANSYSVVSYGFPPETALDAVSRDDIAYTVNDPTNPPTGPAIVCVGQRDDNPYRARYNAAMYRTAISPGVPPPHTLGNDPLGTGVAGKNNPTNASWILPGNYEYSYPIANPAVAGLSGLIGLRNIGDLGQVYFAASTWDGSATPPTPFTKNVINFTPNPTPPIASLAPILFGSGISTAPGRLDPRASVNAGGTYPDVPKAVLLNEFFTLLPGDFTRTDNPNRVYGKINVNTATREALMQLPLLTSVVMPLKAADGTTTINVQPFTKAAAVEFTLAYRERRAVNPAYVAAYAGCPAYPDYTTRYTTADTRLTGLRGTSDINGFLTPGEVAIPLSDYAHWLMGIAYPYAENTNITRAYWYVDVRDAMYRSISNLITVNSDVFVVNMMLQMQPSTTAAAAANLANPRQRWHYIAVIDRGNCMTVTDTPAVLLFAEVK